MAILKSFQADALKIIVADSRDAMGRIAAREAAARLRALLAEKAEVNVILAAAPSQNETLSGLLLESGIDWTRVNAFHMDEYVGLSPEKPQSFNHYLDEHIFGKAPFHTVNRLRGDAEDACAECARYAALLAANPVDLVMMGIGENGHIAFNDPGVADFYDPMLVKVVELDGVCRMQQVNDGCFLSLAQVPARALTLTIPALMAAKHLICSVPAKTKRAAVTKAVRDEISPRLPATILRTHADATLFCDLDSGEEIL